MAFANILHYTARIGKKNDRATSTQARLTAEDCDAATTTDAAAAGDAGAGADGMDGGARLGSDLMVVC